MRGIPSEPTENCSREIFIALETEVRAGKTEMLVAIAETQSMPQQVFDVPYLSPGVSVWDIPST